MLSDFKPAPELNAMAKQAMEQARGAVDTYFDFLKKTMSSFPSGGTEFGEKLKSYSEQNVAATHEFIKQLSQAKDFQDVVRIKTAFMQNLFEEFSEQTKPPDAPAGAFILSFPNASRSCVCD
jgi:hypothetical protein